MATLAHAGDDDTAMAGPHHANRLVEAVAQRRAELRFQRAQAFSLKLEGARGRFDRLAMAVTP